MPNRDDVLELLQEAAQLGHALPKVALLEEAVRRADARRDDELGYQARIALMETALFLGRADVLMIAFAWCLAKAEAEPNRFDYTELLWRYRWAIVNMPSFPSIPRTQIENALADMTRRYKAAGASMRSVHLLRWKVAITMLDRRAASNARKAWSRSAYGWLCDDKQTERVTQLKYLLMRERWEEAIALAEDYIEGRPNLCFEDSVLAWLLIPLLRVNRAADAMRCHVRCFTKTQHNVALVIRGANNMEFLALTHNFARAVKIVERHLPFCMTSDPEDQFDFYLAMITLFRMLQQVGRVSLKMKLEPHCHGYQVDGKYDLAAMERLYEQHVATLAALYDARNENAEHRRLLDESRAVLRFACPLPLP